jgi:hypothetical protein
MIAIWSLAVFTGVISLARHAAQPGAAALAAASLPASQTAPSATPLATLIMTVHPQCPCTRASLDELERIMAHCHGRLNALILFAEPPGLQADPAGTDFWKTAQDMPDVKCVRDPGGLRAAQLGAETSGQVFLYDTQAKLQFSGGITSARAHAGESDGDDAIIAIVDGTQPLTHRTPVFGCSLR